MNNRDILNLKYEICDNVEYTIDENGIVTLLEKQNHKIQNLFRKLHFHIPEYRKVELDKYSSSVFTLINGENSIEDIGKQLDSLYGEKVHPLYERLLLFLNHIDVDCNYIEKTYWC